mgnify:CR=1 FL=1
MKEVEMRSWSVIEFLYFILDAHPEIKILNWLDSMYSTFFGHLEQNQIWTPYFHGLKYDQYTQIRLSSHSEM